MSVNDPLIMPDDRLEELGALYLAENRPVTFMQFAADRNQALENDLYRVRRDAGDGHS